MTRLTGKRRLEQRNLLNEELLAIVIIIANNCFRKFSYRLSLLGTSSTLFSLLTD